MKDFNETWVREQLTGCDERDRDWQRLEELREERDSLSDDKVRDWPDAIELAELEEKYKRGEL